MVGSFVVPTMSGGGRPTGRTRKSSSQQPVSLLQGNESGLLYPRFFFSREISV
jgi:hypothetical protein